MALEVILNQTLTIEYDKIKNIFLLNFPINVAPSALYSPVKDLPFLKYVERLLKPKFAVAESFSKGWSKMNP